MIHEKSTVILNGINRIHSPTVRIGVKILFVLGSIGFQPVREKVNSIRT
jgi:hypothetical protein